ncbi:MAG: hypothetical protein V1921_06365 [Candidatus Altiarchaeota archaeon]
MTGTKVVKLKLDDGSLGERLPQIRENTAEKAVELYLTLGERDPIISCHNRAVSAFQEYDASSTQLQNVINTLEENFGSDEEYSWRAGFIVNALVLNSKHARLKIKPKLPLDYIGFKMDAKKHITVEGDLGDETGADMQDGRIHVGGSAKNQTGSGMKGGSIQVDGNVNWLTAANMQGGTLHIRGDAGNALGFGLCGGTIIVEGNIGNRTADMMHGGVIKAGGKIESIDENYQSGEIWESEIKVRG